MTPPSGWDGKCFRELFTKPDQWRQTRTKVDVLGYADHVLETQFTDAELRAWFPKMHEWGIEFGLEVGAVTPWGTTGEATFNIERKM
jgi:hypothetical protein